MGLVVSIELSELSELVELVELAGLAVVVEVVFVVVVAVAAGYIGVAGLLEVAAPALHFQQVLHKNCRTYRQRQSYFRNLCKTSQPSLIRAAISFTEKSAFYTTTTYAIFAHERNPRERQLHECPTKPQKTSCNFSGVCVYRISSMATADATAVLFCADPS